MKIETLLGASNCMHVVHSVGFRAAYLIQCNQSVTKIGSNFRSNKNWYSSMMSPMHVVWHVSHVVKKLAYFVHAYNIFCTRL